MLANTGSVNNEATTVFPLFQTQTQTRAGRCGGCGAGGEQGQGEGN